MQGSARSPGPTLRWPQTLSYPNADLGSVGALGPPQQRLLFFSAGVALVLVVAASNALSFAEVLAPVLAMVGAFVIGKG